MLQFYFLSILLNGLAGLVFIYTQKKQFPDSAPSDSSLDADAFESASAENPDSFSESSDPSKGILSLSFLDDSVFRLVVGILSGLVGILKLLSPIQYDIPVIGDLIPAVAGMAACGSLLVEYYQNNSDIELHLPSGITEFFTEGKKYLGIFCLIAGVLHFIFPRVLFL